MAAFFLFLGLIMAIIRVETNNAVFFIVRQPHPGEALTAYLFLAPNFIGFLVFTSLPVFASLASSFVKWDLLSPPQFVGLHNFIELIEDKFFWKFCFTYF